MWWEPSKLELLEVCFLLQETWVQILSLSLHCVTLRRLALRLTFFQTYPKVNNTIKTIVVRGWGPWQWLLMDRGFLLGVIFWKWRVVMAAQLCEYAKKRMDCIFFLRANFVICKLYLQLFFNWMPTVQSKGSPSAYRSDSPILSSEPILFHLYLYPLPLSQIILKRISDILCLCLSIYLR